MADAIVPPASEEFQALMAATQESHTPASGDDFYPPDGDYTWLLTEASTATYKEKDGTPRWSVDTKLQVMEGDHEGKVHRGPSCNSGHAMRIDNLLKLASYLSGESVTDQQEATNVILSAGKSGDRALYGSIKRNTSKTNGRTYVNVYINGCAD